MLTKVCGYMNAPRRAREVSGVELDLGGMMKSAAQGPLATDWR